MKKNYGVLLLNVGTPERNNYWSVKKYLEQFLLDHRIIDMPFFLRYILVKGFITPFRAASSAKKYRDIWQTDGSPLYTQTKQQTAILQNYIGEDFTCVFAMRYGKPSIASQIAQLMQLNCEQLIICPLFPQYSSAASGSALEEVFACLKNYHHIPQIKTLAPFYKESFFVDAWAFNIAPYLSAKKHMIFSFHGLPEQHIRRSHDDTPCAWVSPCPSDKAKYFCYRAQSFATARLIAAKLNLSAQNYSVCFQSRLGGKTWIQPYLRDTIVQRYKEGATDIVVACPSFVSDCLETIHEIGVEEQAYFTKLSQKNLELVPCLNINELWLKGLAQKISQLALV